MIYVATLCGDEDDTYRHFFYDVDSMVIYSTHYTKTTEYKTRVSPDIKFDIKTNEKSKYAGTRLHRIDVTIPDKCKWHLYHYKDTFHFVFNKIEQLIFENI